MAGVKTILEGFREDGRGGSSLRGGLRCAAVTSTLRFAASHSPFFLYMPVMIMAVLAATSGTSHECSQACACQSVDAAWQLWRSHRAARRMAVGLEQGAVDSTSLEEAQNEVSTSINAVRLFRDKCGQKEDAASCSAIVRRSCSCRPHRLLNVTRIVSRKLDDAAAGVLFGEGEENMLKLSTASQWVLQSLMRVATELDRLGRTCMTEAAASKRHGRSPRLRAAAGASSADDVAPAVDDSTLRWPQS